MAGTDRSQAAVLGGPAIVLVQPQLGDNIGMVARAMLNFGLEELRVVAPRDGWPNPAAIAAAAGAERLLEAAKLYDSTAEALSDLTLVYGTTARTRDMVKPVVTARQAAAELRAGEGEGARVAVVFGPERSGLVNDDLALCDALLRVPLNPAFASLNLAQAVLLIGYEWFQAGDQTEPRYLEVSASGQPTKAELLGFYERLENHLDRSGFLRPPEKRPGMVRNLRNLFQRVALTDQDLRTLHGIVSALWHGPRDGGER
ncbi:MAG: RNA methyltransferase [Pseudomonadota bacterium]